MSFLHVDRSAPATYSGKVRGEAHAIEMPRSQAHARASKSRADDSSFDMFQWLTSEAQQAFIVACRRRHFCEGRRIYSQSEPGNEMYRIVSGSVRMAAIRHGREALYMVLQPGDCFGVHSLVDGAPRSHTATARGGAQLQVLRSDAFQRLRENHPSFGDAIVRVISRHARLLSEYLASSTVDELSRRVAQRLLWTRTLAASSGARTGLITRLSQSDLALMVGASRQAVNKVLRRFQEDGLISIHYKSIEVHDIDRLQCAE